MILWTFPIVLLHSIEARFNAYGVQEEGTSDDQTFARAGRYVLIAARASGMQKHPRPA